ncbi:AMP-binding protein [Streptomyces sp. SID8356]|uniref:fatty acyl-AMP ligase n=1 Tax=unclassified Streptomyces TaxID=2593676 RepID=UPI00036432AF|nr:MULTISPECIES: fatty acyl-AMP ligase [unclassified Streptomyces]MYT35901.1 AMP-binding protein [Streptomyces sp. SID8356]
MPERESLVALLRERAAAHGERPAVGFSADPADPAAYEETTYRELDETARRIAVLLRSAGVAEGDRVLLLHPPGLGFPRGFTGCLYAGAIAVPAPMPDGYRRQRERLAGIARDARVSAVLTDRVTAEAVTAWARECGLPDLPVLAVDPGALPPAGDWREPRIGARTVAFLQYTSGSTSDPKGVVVDHGNVLANAEAFVGTVDVRQDTRWGGWLPMYHDFGLIGLLITPLTLGSTTVLMSAATFLKRPFLWLRLMDAYDLQVSPAPNFAYDLCVQRVTEAQSEGLDLSRWTHAMNGSEPVRARTLTAFAERFGAAGLRAGALTPGYGLAEATLCVSGAPSHRPPVITRVDAGALAEDAFRPAGPATPPGAARPLVSSGRLCPGVEVVAVDPGDGTVLPEGTIGELWVRGPSVARGYWEKEEQSALTFGAVTRDGRGGWLRTGDRGLLADGELYVTGRIKELLILGGRNLYPHDLEAAVRATHPALERTATAVFTVPSAGDQLVVVQEARPAQLGTASAGELIDRVTRALGREFGVAVPNVVLVRPGDVQRTTSGKIQRTLTRELLLGGELRVVEQRVSPALERARAAYATTGAHP